MSKELKKDSLNLNPFNQGSAPPPPPPVDDSSHKTINDSIGNPFGKAEKMGGKSYNDAKKNDAGAEGLNPMNSMDLSKDKKEGVKALSHLEKGKSFNQMKELEKARVDEGKPLAEKVAARQERNDRDVKATKTPSGQKTRTARSGNRRAKEIESGSERRTGEKIVGTPTTIENAVGMHPEKTFGVHMHSGTMAGKNLPIGDGPGTAAPVHADKNGKSYRVGGLYGANSFSARVRHDQVMEGMIKPMLKSEVEPGESLSQHRTTYDETKKVESLLKSLIKTKNKEALQKALEKIDQLRSGLDK